MEVEDHANHIRPYESSREYAKFALVIFLILAASALLTYWRGWTTRQLLDDIMAVFFITFAMFKFATIETFAQTYRIYDPIAKHIPVWGYAFPFVEALLGFSYLLTNKSSTLYFATLVITGLAGWGVWRELRIGTRQRRRSQMMCACLGSVIQLPLSKVSFVEDFGMFVMAAMMLVIH